jgi:hypothetical protein
MHEKFKQPLAPFYYEESPNSMLKLYVIPVDLELDLCESIPQILRQANRLEQEDQPLSSHSDGSK